MRMLGLAVVVCCGIVLAGGQSTDTDISRLKWMSGSWVMEHDGTRVEEQWTAPRAGTMLGVGRTIRGERTVFFEFLRIESGPDGLTYLAAPRGRHPATPFKMIELTDDKVVFENPEHDFPTRVTYWRNGDDGLNARIEGNRNGQHAEENWKYKRSVGE